jgi:hypothetical protein
MERGAFESVAVVRQQNIVFIQDCEDLVGGRFERHGLPPQTYPPLCLAKGYTHGLTRKVLNALENTLAVSASGRSAICVGVPSSYVEKMKPIAQAQLFVEALKKHMQATFPHQRLQEGLAPFDFKYWSRTTGESLRDPLRETALLNTYFKPWAVCRRADLDSVTSGFFRVRNQAKEFHDKGQLSIAACWGQAAAARNVAKDYPEFTKVLAPALVQWLGNGEIEGDASVLKQMGVRSRGLSHDLLRASVKVRLDGPRPDELNEIFGLPPHPWLGQTEIPRPLRLQNENDPTPAQRLRRQAAAE